MGSVRRHGAHRPRRAAGAAPRRSRRRRATLLRPPDAAPPDHVPHVLLRRHARLQQPVPEERRRPVLPDRALHDARLHRAVRHAHPAPGGVREGDAVLWTRRRRLPARRRPGEARRDAVRARRRVRTHDERLHRAERHLHEAGTRRRRQRLGASDALQQRQRLRAASTHRHRQRPGVQRLLSRPARQPHLRLAARRLQSARLSHRLDQRRTDQCHVAGDAPHQRQRQGRYADAHSRRVLRRHEATPLVAQCLHGGRRRPLLRPRPAPGDCSVEGRRPPGRREGG